MPRQQGAACCLRRFLYRQHCANLLLNILHMNLAASYADSYGRVCSVPLQVSLPPAMYLRFSPHQHGSAAEAPRKLQKSPKTTGLQLCGGTDASFAPPVGYMQVGLGTRSLCSLYGSLCIALAAAARGHHCVMERWKHPMNPALMSPLCCSMCFRHSWQSCRGWR